MKLLPEMVEQKRDQSLPIPSTYIQLQNGER